MSSGSIDSLEHLSPTELAGLVRGLIGEVERLRRDNEKLGAAVSALRIENLRLKDEVRRLKGLPPKASDQTLGHGEGDGSSGVGKAEPGGRMGRRRVVAVPAHRN